MAKPPLSMKPTGWFQVAWSDDIAIGDDQVEGEPGEVLSRQVAAIKSLVVGMGLST